MVVIKQEIGSRIKELRIYKVKMNQKDFCKLINKDRTYLSRVESGKQNITIDTLNEICVALGVDLAYFFKDIKSNSYEEWLDNVVL